MPLELKSSLGENLYVGDLLKHVNPSIIYQEERCFCQEYLWWLLKQKWNLQSIFISCLNYGGGAETLINFGWNSAYLKPQHRKQDDKKMERKITV